MLTNLFGFALLLAMTVTAPAAVEMMKVVAKEGTWELRHGKDAFTDKSSCIMTVATKPYVQITSDSFTVGYRGRGGVKGYTVRVDDEPAGQMQLPNIIEKETHVLLFQGEAFSTIMKAKRIRIQVLTVTTNLVTDRADFWRYVLISCFKARAAAA